MNDLLVRALATLSSIPGLRATSRMLDVEGATPKAGSVSKSVRPRADCVVDVSTAVGTVQVAAHVVASVTMRHVPTVVSHLRAIQEAQSMPAVLVKAYVSNDVATQLVEQGLAFVDLVGNAHVVGPGVFVHVQGRPRPRHFPRAGMTYSDLTLTFALLAQPDLLGRPMRAIAQMTGVSLGKVSETSRLLVNMNHVAEVPLGRRVADARRLLERWELGYAEVIRPRANVTHWSPPSA